MLVVLAVVVPLISVSVSLMVLSVRTSRQIAEDLGNTLVTDATTHIGTQIHDYLGASERISDLYARRLEAGILSPDDLQSWRRPMLDSLVTRPMVASICFANTKGDAVWLSRIHGRKNFEFGWADGQTHQQTAIEIDDDNTLVGDIPERSKLPYIPSERPWWKAALAHDCPVWTSIYAWYPASQTDTETGAGYTREVKDARDHTLGVLVVDTTLRSLSDFIANLPAGRQGQIFIVDEKGLLVAASHGPVTAPDGSRVTMKSAGTPAGIAASVVVADLVATSAPSDPAAPLPTPIDHHEEITVNGEPAWAQMTPILYTGIHWRAVVVIPERVFMAKAHDEQNRALALAGLAVACALILGYFLARRIIQPLVALSDHVKRIGRGDFESRLHLNAARELVDLSEDLNGMAADLKNRIQLLHSLAVATQVQESLLPTASPTSIRLDIYGASKYCDQAGADYYDFIEIGDLPDQRALLAVGDVMGHGLGAALLMASARAALRATALRSGALGELLNAVNTVLAADNRHGRFMTMLLVMLEPKQQVVRWASAGHGPPILYEPRADDFIDLVGGDIPLGVEKATKYEEYTFPCLNPHQVMLLGTDGIWEARNAQGELFGKDRLRAVLRANLDRSARDIAKAIDHALGSFLAGAKSHDDVTFVVIKVLPVPSDVRARFTEQLDEHE
jgi:sigma-B regulation protein RsbU (phosphoserine phosphatase)